MVHIDIDRDRVYAYAPPDNAIDVPGITEDGDVAVLPIQINLWKVGLWVSVAPEASDTQSCTSELSQAGETVCC